MFVIFIGITGLDYSGLVLVSSFSIVKIKFIESECHKAALTNFVLFCNMQKLFLLRSRGVKKILQLHKESMLIFMEMRRMLNFQLEISWMIVCAKISDLALQNHQKHLSLELVQDLQNLISNHPLKNQLHFPAIFINQTVFAEMVFNYLILASVIAHL